jgi:3'-phosphoadenosine 5'-phosphosulfate sulfotransferase (PAPS reductase)/FAD synthetase
MNRVPPHNLEIIHVVALSGGKDSTAMALRLRELNPSRQFEFVVTPTGDELPPMESHYANIEYELGQSLRRITTLTMMELINEQKMIPNFRARFCTRILKIEPFIEYMRSLPDGSVWYSGLRSDEPTRAGVDLGSDLARFKIRYPLREWGWGIGEVVEYLEHRDITIPARTDCGCCFYQRLEEWRQLWIDYPERYQTYVNIENEMGYTFRSPGRDTWPAALGGLRDEFESGRVPRKYNGRRANSSCEWCAR